jgi:hypothetical protein
LTNNLEQYKDDEEEDEKESSFQGYEDNEIECKICKAPPTYANKIPLGTRKRISIKVMKKIK